MGDFGLYAALSGTDNWAQKRQDKMSNLMMLERMEQRSEKQLAAQMQAEAGIQEMLDKMATFDVLPEDQKAIQQKEQEARLSIIKGITKFNGDLKRYMSSGGVTDLGEYQRSILTSSEMKNAVHNKAQYAQYIDAKQKDMFVGKSEIDVPVFDSNGNPKMKDGEIVRQRKKLTMEEQMALRKRGLLDRLQVGTIEQKGRINPEFFKKNYKDARRPWSSDNVVTEQNIYDYLISTGVSEEQADEMSNRYGKAHEGSPQTAMKWNAMNAYDLQLLKSKIEYNLGKGKGKTGSDKRKITNNLRSDYSKLRDNPGKMLPTIGVNADPTARGAALNLSPNEATFWTNHFKNKNPIAYDAHYGNAGDEEKELGLGKYDLRNADVYLKEKVIKTNPDNGKNEAFLLAEVFYPEDTAPDGINDYNFNRSNFKEVDDRVVGSYIDKDDEEKKYIEEDGYIGHVYIRVEDEVQDLGFNTEYAKELGRHTDILNYQRGATPQGDVQDNFLNKEAMIQRTMQSQDISREEAIEEVNKAIAMASAF
jgi:hypothetical protein